MEFHPISELDARMKPETLAKARKLYEQESLNLKRKTMREKHDVKQADMARFTQTAVSKPEHRKDALISTRIDYPGSLSMGLEIAALPQGSNTEREVLLKV